MEITQSKKILADILANNDWTGNKHFVMSVMQVSHVTQCYEDFYWAAAPLSLLGIWTFLDTYLY